LPHFVTSEFVRELKKRLWEIFLPEMDRLLPGCGDIRNQ
jgi:hypothetical protein